ncbi:MAG: hypothetical protein ACE5I3_04410 [Phycisphaerae bacterium]
MAVQFAPTDSGSSVLAIDSLPPTDWSGLLARRSDNTNTATPTISIVASTFVRESVDETFDYALSRYENLLRRLAD